MYNNELILKIKRIIYDIYDRNTSFSIISRLASEIAIHIPNTTIQSISKDHNGITLSFICNSDHVNKQDIENITMNIISEFIRQNITHLLSEDELRLLDGNIVCNLFNVMYCRGMSFSIVI